MKKIAVYGIIFLVSISTLFRGLYFSYETYAFLTALALFSVVYFFSKMISNEPVHINSLFVILGIVLAAATALSFVKALNPRENLGSLLLYTELLIVFIVLYDYFYDKKQQFTQVMMLPVLLTGFACAVVGMIALTGSFNIWDVTTFGNRIGSTFQYANTASIYFAICCIFAITLTNASKSILLRALVAGMGNIIVFALFLTGSRGGYIVGMVTILLLLALQPSGRKISGGIGFICMLVPVFITMKGFNMGTAAHDNLAAVKWLVISFILAAVTYLLLYLLLKITIKDKQLNMPKGSGLVFAAALVIVMVLAFVYRSSIFSLLPPILGSRLARLSFSDINVLYRLDFDKDALKLIAANWLSGLGGDGWKARYQSVQGYFYTAVFVHNNYLQVFVESGILGFLSYMALAFFSAVSAFYSFLKSRDNTLKTYAAGLLCGFLALALHASFDFDLSFISLTLLFWVMFAASAASLPDVSGKTGGGGRKHLSIDKWKTTINSGAAKIILIIVCSVLFSVHALYFAGASNRQIAFDYMQEKNYKQAMVYYEEAHRLDPANTAYTFDLAKLYHYYAKKSIKEEYRQIWLEKARAAGEKNVNGNKYYPAYINTLVQIYLDSDMPLQALELSQKLVSYQKYNGENYELLARSYLAAAVYYEKSGNGEKVKELLKKCIEIDKDPYLHRSKIDKPYDVNSEEIISSYQHSKELAEYLKEARDFLENNE